MCVVYWPAVGSRWTSCAGSQVMPMRTENMTDAFTARFPCDAYLQEKNKTKKGGNNVAASVKRSKGARTLFCASAGSVIASRRTACMPSLNTCQVRSGFGAHTHVHMGVCQLFPCAPKLDPRRKHVFTHAAAVGSPSGADVTQMLYRTRARTATLAAMTNSAGLLTPRAVPLP